MSTKKQEIITLEQNAFDATNIPSSISSIKNHLSEAVSIALGGVSVEQFIVDNKIDLSKASHQKKLTGIAYSVSKSKTLFAGLIKEKQEEAAVESKKLLEIRKDFVSFCDGLRDEIQKPVKDYKAEQERKQEEAERALQNIVRYRTPVNEGGLYCETMGTAQIDDLLKSLELIDTDNDRFYTLKDEAKIQVDESKAWLKEKAYEKLLQAQEQARIEKEKKEAQELAAFERQLNRIMMFAEQSHVGGRILTNMSSDSVGDLISQLMRLEFSGIRTDELEHQRSGVYKKLNFLKEQAQQNELKKAEHQAQCRIKKFHEMTSKALDCESRKYDRNSFDEASLAIISVRDLLDYFRTQEAENIDDKSLNKALFALHQEFEKINQDIEVIEKRWEKEAQKKKEEELERAREEERQRIKKEESERKERYKRDNEKLSQVREDIMKALIESNKQVEMALQQDPIYSTLSDSDKQRYVSSKMITSEEASAASVALVKCLKFDIQIPHLEIKIKNK